MSARRLLPLAVLGTALALALTAAWRFASPHPAPARAPSAAPAAGPPASAAGEAPRSELPPLPRQSVRIYFPGVEWDGLVAEEREIFGTPAPGDRAKQILSDLLAGPAGQQAARAVPPGTLLRQVYVLASGTAYLDFSTDLQLAMGGGSTEELLTVYAIVDSIALNVPEIERVGILVNGGPVETLNGHVDLRRPLPPNRSYILEQEPGEESVVVRAREP